MKFTLSIEDKHGGIADEYSFDEGEFLVGRSHSADIILPSDNVSRRHARLYTIEGRCYIEDLGSANGVFLNGRRIHEVMEIEGTAQIRVGDYYLHVRGEEAPQAEDKVHCRIRGLDHGVADQIFPIKRTVNLVGRGKDCTVTIIDPSVSRIHAKLTVERSGAISLEDLKSSNGTFVNDEKIDVATLNHKDRLRIGNVELMVEFPELAPDEDEDEDGDGGLSLAWTQNDDASGQRVMIGVIAAVVVLGGLLLMLFSDKLFGGSESPDAQASATEVRPAKESDGTSGTEAEDDLAMLEKRGAEFLKSRDWDQASATWEKIKELDPLHPRAQRALNRIDSEMRIRDTLEKARSAKKEQRYGEAARKLRSITDPDSSYLREAQEELVRLQEMKPSLVVQAESLFKSRDCKDALKLYEQARELDPADESLTARIKAVEKSKRKCR